MQNTRLFTDIVFKEPPDDSIWSRIRCMGLFVAERLCCRGALCCSAQLVNRYARYHPVRTYMPDQFR
jgi:hypothetical protein